MDVNYYQYKKEITLSEELEITPSGIPLKAVSKTSSVDDSGNVSETDLNEVRDENVNFGYDGDTVDGWYRRGEPVGIEAFYGYKGTSEEKYFQYIYDEDDCTGEAGDGPTQLKILRNPDINISELKNAAIERRSNVSDSVEVEDVPILPIHKMLTGDDIEINGNLVKRRNSILPTSENILDMAGCGIIGNSGLSINKIKNYSSKLDGKVRPISKKTFEKSMATLKGNLNRNNIDVVVTKFTEKLNSDEENPQDLNYSFLERDVMYGSTGESNGFNLVSKRNGYFTDQEIEDAFNAFIESDDGHSVLNELGDDGISPYSMSLKEVSRYATGIDRDDLMNELKSAVDDFNETINNPEFPGMEPIDFNYTGGIGDIIGLDKDAIYEDYDEDKIKGYLAAAYTASITSGIPLTFDSPIETLREIKEIIKKIEWYEYFVGVPFNDRTQSWYDGVSMTSFLSDKSLITGEKATKEESNENDTYYRHKKLARFAVVVDYGFKKIKVSDGGFFGAATYRYEDQGIRWVLVEFNNTEPFNNYRTNNKKSGKRAEDGSCAFEPFEDTKPSPIPVDVQVTFNMPHLPFDKELRRLAFDTYGFLDQGEFAIHESVYTDNGSDKNKAAKLADVFDNGKGKYVANDSTLASMMGIGTKQLDESERLEGYTVFPEESKDIKSLRSGVGLYDKAQFLIHLLKTEFGYDRVKVTDALRSSERQDEKQLGGVTSNMLSWHNYGLSLKVVITEIDGYSLIKEGSDDFFKLFEITKLFNNLCNSGKLGKTFNLVWGGQFKTNPDIFTWEFLPIGVGHKEAFKFRDAIYNQKDPFVSNEFVDTRNFLVAEKPQDSSPFILSKSKAFKNALELNGVKYVHPTKIRNNRLPNNLVLKDIQEFFYLVERKKEANGESLVGTIQAWKQANPISYKQLILYNSMLGNYAFVRALLGIDYIEDFNRYLLAGTSGDPVKFVKNVLGNYSYERMKLVISGEQDGKYISPSDLKLHVPFNNVYSTQPEGNGNTFGQKQMDQLNFRLEELGEYVSEEEAINEDQMYYIHELIRDYILEEMQTIKEDFEGITSGLMYDALFNGPNKDDVDLLENEYGVISTQDLISFEQLELMYERWKINNNAGTDYNGDLNGLGANNENLDSPKGSVYEKLISNTQSNGVVLAKIGAEKPVESEVEVTSREKAIKRLLGDTAPDVRDIL